MKQPSDGNKIKFIYWFAYFNLESPSVRYRAKYPLEYFKENYSIGYYLVIPGYTIKHILRFLRAYVSAFLFRKRNSIIVIQRVNSSYIYALFLKLLVWFQKKNTVYDLDDADYLEYEIKSLYHFVINCDKCSAGSSMIKRHLEKKNSSTFKITSPTVDLGIIKKTKNKFFHIGWVGGYSWGNRESLVELVFPAIKALNIDLKLTLIGVTKGEDFNFIREYFRGNRNIELNILEDVDWNDERGLQSQIVEFDVGVATLREVAHQKSKSGIKVKQNLSLGIPVLCNNLLENNVIIEDGINGYFCQNSAEFEFRLNEFFRMDNDRYMEFSVAALASINKFNHEYYWERWNLLYS